MNYCQIKYFRCHRSIFDDIFAFWIAKHSNGGAWIYRAVLHCDLRAVSLALLCCLCAAKIGSGRRGPGSISGARGFARRLCCSCGRSALASSIPGDRKCVGAVLLLPLSRVTGSGLMLLLWLHLGLFDVVCVALFRPPQCAFGVSCRGWLLGALFVSSYSCVVGPRSWAGFCAFWGFLPLFALFHLFPLFVSL